jgi:hypothetical protein
MLFQVPFQGVLGVDSHGGFSDPHQMKYVPRRRFTG